MCYSIISEKIDLREDVCAVLMGESDCDEDFDLRVIKREIGLPSLFN